MPIVNRKFGRKFGRKIGRKIGASYWVALAETVLAKKSETRLRTALS
jgi:hypothetical protein